MRQTGQVNAGGKAARRSGARSAIERGRLQRAVCPDLISRVRIAGRMLDDGLSLAVVMSLVNVGAVEKGLGVSARLIWELTGREPRWTEEEIVWVCRNFVCSAFAILEERDPCRDIETRRFYVTADAETIAHEASMMRAKADRLLGRADLVARAAITSGAGLPMWQPEQAERLPVGAEIKRGAEAA